MIKHLEATLNQQIATLGMSEEFCGVTEILGFHTLGDVTKHHTRELAKLPGFSVHLIHEYVSFLEERGLGHYVDPIK
ncbi:MAG: hypothetical protein V4663_02270 [Bacteroidota bacterium]